MARRKQSLIFIDWNSGHPGRVQVSMGLGSGFRGSMLPGERKKYGLKLFGSKMKEKITFRTEDLRGWVSVAGAVGAGGWWGAGPG